MNRLPTLIISGFLGAGKTSLVNHLLANNRGLRLAVLVNDLAELNIDVLQLSRTRLNSVLPTELVELSNGCICCTIRPEFVREVAKLAARGLFDYLIVEATGVAEPLAICEAFHLPDRESRMLLDRARIDAMVSVVDGRTFFDHYLSSKTLIDLGIHTDAEDNRHLCELLAAQVEDADLLILNKTDLLAPHETTLLQELLSRLNPHAEILPAFHSQVDLDKLLHTHLHKEGMLANRPVDPAFESVPESDLYHINSFVYRARRPFHPQRLWDVIHKQPWKGVLRVKGFLWIASRPGLVGFWSQAGRVVNIEVAGEWWTAVPAVDRPHNWDSYDIWTSEEGDQRQELVFVGQRLDEHAIKATLNRCLLTDEEMAGGESMWMVMTDPFPAWDVKANLAHMRALTHELNVN